MTSLTRRERILKATWELMEARRGQGVRIEEIAQAASVSRQAVYLHFGNRTDLLIATVRYVDEVFQFNERIQAACNAGGGVMSLEDFVLVWGNYIPQIYGLAKALLAARATDEAAAAAWNDRMSAHYAGSRLIIEQIRREGKLVAGWSIEQATDFLWSTVSVQTWENLTVERGWTQEDYLRRTQEALKRVLLKSVV